MNDFTLKASTPWPAVSPLGSALSSKPYIYRGKSNPRALQILQELTSSDSPKITS